MEGTKAVVAGKDAEKPAPSHVGTQPVKRMADIFGMKEDTRLA